MSILINEVQNAQSLNLENTLFNVEINHPEHGWISYTLNPEDTDETINNGDLLTLIGTTFTAYVAPTQAELDAEQTLFIRDNRNNFLVTEVDPIVGNPFLWADLPSDKQNAWTTYRTDLLNVPQQSGFPNTIIWPTKPT
jgi:hypothetical protein